MTIGYGYIALADIEAASLAFKQTLEDGLSGGNFYAAIYGPFNLVMNAILVGRLSDALQLCETYIEQFNRIKAGQSFPPIGALYILKGSILLEHDQLAEAEKALQEGLELIRWTGETSGHIKGYTALARLHAIQGERSGMLEAVKTLAEFWPNGSLYTQALRHRLSMRHWADDPDVRKDARTWLAQAGIEFFELTDIDRVYPNNAISFETYLNAAHVVAFLAEIKPDGYPIESIHAYLKCQQGFAASHGFVSRVVEIAIARSLLYQVSGKKPEALEALERALNTAAPTGLLRIFIDECEHLQVLLKTVKPRLTDRASIAYTNRLVDAMNCEPVKAETAEEGGALLSERELEVLRFLVRGLSYEEIGRQLFLSLNTIQFHVKNIYGKLLVNRRVQAIEKAREMNLI